MSEPPMTVLSASLRIDKGHKEFHALDMNEGWHCLLLETHFYAEG